MIRIALNHKTIYHYDRLVNLGPQVIRLRPAPHCRTPINSFSLQVKPEKHFINWQQDPHSNYLARLIFPDATRIFEVEIDLIAEMTVINPFDFFLEGNATEFPFDYDADTARTLAPFLQKKQPGPLMSRLIQSLDIRKQKTNDFLVQLNQKIHNEVSYLIRMEPGVQSPESTLEIGSGSCRDSAWLLTEALRHFGLASRFVSGYLIQLKPDVKSLDGPSGASEDFTDLHAWAEVYLPGAGWIGLDPTSGLLAGEGHIPLACTPEPIGAAPVYGAVDKSEVEFHHEMSVTRVYEDPRVTKPYTESQWNQINELGLKVDQALLKSDVRLTMGGEPTFVSIDDMDGDEWNTEAVGPTKQKRSAELIRKLKERFSDNGLLHYGQGKWYPGEQLPRWAFTCLWRVDGQPVWKDPSRLADIEEDYGYTIENAKQFSLALSRRLQVNPDHVMSAYEDALYYVWKEQRLAANESVFQSSLQDEVERARIARVFSRGLKEPVGCVLPLKPHWWENRPRWTSGRWPVKADQMFLIPGDSAMGLRLPLDSIGNELSQSERELESIPMVPFETGPGLPDYEDLRRRSFATPLGSSAKSPAWVQQGAGLKEPSIYSASPDSDRPGIQIQARNRAVAADPGNGQGAPLSQSNVQKGSGSTVSVAPVDDAMSPNDCADSDDAIRTALCVEPREGKLYVFMPPVNRLEEYLELLAAIEETASELDVKVVIEGYLPPADHRVEQLKVTPDPGVIEVNVQPSDNWNDLVEVTRGVYDDARTCRLGTEKFDLDGTHTGTGGGNHIVLGARVPSDSAFLRRPDLLRSLISYWHNHPSLSYYFSGRFIGPTSQAPRADEGRRDTVHELEIAFEQIPLSGECPPWIVDRVFRNLLVDLTGNTHRAEFCIDKLYSPDSPTGRLGLVEFRGFEMPPHWQMSLTQQLLIRALVARFWNQPYTEKLVDWNTTLHDRWLLPHFQKADFADVIEETRCAGFPLERRWFDPHFEFRFPAIGELSQQGIQVELRTAIEPWYVLGEESSAGGTARYVDSSIERIEVKASGLNADRYVLSCNGRRIPLHPTGTEGEYVAGIRYRAWQPPSCLHPTIPVDEPLVIDVIDQWMQRSIGGCQYHVGHPGGLNPSTFPVNSYEADGRRASRFSRIRHTGGRLEIPALENNPGFPMTLDLRRNRNNR